MEKNKDLTIEETFNLAIKNHQEGKTDIAEELYNQVLKINPNHSQALNNIAIIFTNLKKYQRAKECYEKAIEINPNYADAHNNLGTVFFKLKENLKAKDCYEKAIKINPNYVDALNNLGVTFKDLKDYQKAKECFEKSIEINPVYVDVYYNLGTVFFELGDLKKEKECYEKAIELNPNHIGAHNNLGNVFRLLTENQKAKECYEKVIELNPNHFKSYNNLGNIFYELGENQRAKECYEKAIELNPNFTDAYYNLHSTSSNIDEALTILTKSDKIDKNNMRIKITIAYLLGYKGNFNQFNDLLASSNANHPYIRSVKWIFSLPKLPDIFFSRSNFFDAIISLVDNSRPFYEFGVWNGASFKYLINNFKKGFGFDTFKGLPEDWHNTPKGTYSSFGVVPKIEGGEFIVGKFEDTLPDFFSREKPMASLINFDADLYSSTLCALDYSNKVIDEKTILIFDELIMNNKWEEDEFKALNEFCGKLGYSYDVIAVSFFTKQVAVKLKKN